MQADEILKLNDIFFFLYSTKVVLGLYSICNLATKHQKGF